MTASQAPPAVAWGTKAIALAEGLGETEIVVHALNNVGASRGRRDEDGSPELERSRRLALEAGLKEHVARAYINLCWYAAERREFARAHTYFDEGSPTAPPTTSSRRGLTCSA